MPTKIEGTLDFPSPAIKKLHEIQGIDIGKGEVFFKRTDEIQLPTDFIFTDKKGKEIWEFSTNVLCYVGQRGFTIVISLYDELIKIVIGGIEFDRVYQEIPEQIQIDMEINRNMILEKSIFEINHLENSVKFLRLLKDENNRLQLKIKSEYGQLMTSYLNFKGNKTYHYIHRHFINLNIIFMLKVIAQYTNQQLIIKENFEINEEMYREIENCFRAIKGGYSRILKTNERLTFQLHEPQHLADLTRNSYFLKVVQKFNNSIYIMGQYFYFPDITHTFSNLKCIKIEQIEDIKNAIFVEMKPCKGCRYELRISRNI
ncbi:hypothetical protein ACKLNO_06435 [Neisseriaceae bacterium B1]